MPKKKITEPNKASDVVEILRIYRKFFYEIVDDVIEAEENLKKNDNQFNRRTYIRTLFYMVEGDTYYRKQLALKLHELFSPHGLFSFSDAEISLLREERYFLDDKGKVRIREYFVSLPENIRYSFDVLARATKSNYVLDVSDDGWDSFKKALEIRNRITHPRSINDIEVSNKDMECINKMDAWYKQITMELLDSVNLEYYTDLIKRIEVKG